jgi:hypothetical protein
MAMLVMRVMPVPVLMLHRFMAMVVLVPLSQMQPEGQDPSIRWR